MLTASKKLSPILGVLIVVFVVAWGIWTFFLIPASDTPNIPQAETPANDAAPAAP